MGGQQSNTASQFVKSKLDFTASTNTMINLQSEVTGVGITSQNITIIIGDSNTEVVVIDNVNLTQRSVQNAKLVQGLANKLDLKQTRDIQQGVMNDLQSTTENVSEFLNLGFLSAGNSNNTNQVIQNAISTAVYDVVDYQSINKVFVNLAADQDGYIHVVGRNIQFTNITFNQDVLFEIAAQQLVENALSAVLATSAVQDVENKVIAYLKNQQTGVKDIGRAGALVINGLLSGLMPIFIIFAVLAVGGGVFYIYYSNAKKHPKVSSHDVNKELHAQEAMSGSGPVDPAVEEARTQAVHAVGMAAGI